MRECLSTSGNSVVAGIIRCTFKQIMGDELTVKWVIIFATLDGQEESMSAVRRGQALAKRPAMAQAFGQYCKVISDTYEITDVNDLSVDEVVARLKKTAIIDGELMIPKYEPVSVDEEAEAMVAVEASEVAAGASAGGIAAGAEAGGAAAGAEAAEASEAAPVAGGAEARKADA